MWRVLASKWPQKSPSFRIRREIHVCFARLNWMLSNDIVRNALTPKNISKDRPEEFRGPGQKRGPSKNVTNQTRHRLFNKSKPHTKKKVTITWNTGSDRDKEAANSVLSQIFRMNRAGAIKFINPATSKPEDSNIRLFAKGINLDQNGLVIANFEDVDETTQIPLVKVVDRKVALKKYSDEVAKRKENELISLGLLKKRSAKAIDSEKKEDVVKQIRVSWQIKDDDLNKQKSHEIQSQLKKGYKVHLYIDDKNSINSKNWASEFESSSSSKGRDKSISSKESLRREAVLEKLKEIVEDYSIQPVIEGDTKTRMLIKLTPKPLLSDRDNKNALKEQRKKERQEKLTIRLEKKKQRGLEKGSNSI